MSVQELAQPPNVREEDTYTKEANEVLPIYRNNFRETGLNIHKKIIVGLAMTVLAFSLFSCYPVNSETAVCAPASSYSQVKFPQTSGYQITRAPILLPEHQIEVPKKFSSLFYHALSSPSHPDSFPLFEAIRQTVIQTSHRWNDGMPPNTSGKAINPDPISFWDYIVVPKDLSLAQLNQQGILSWNRDFSSVVRIPPRIETRGGKRQLVIHEDTLSSDELGFWYALWMTTAPNPSVSSNMQEFIEAINVQTGDGRNFSLNFSENPSLHTTGFQNGVFISDRGERLNVLIQNDRNALVLYPALPYLRGLKVSYILKDGAKTKDIYPLFYNSRSVRFDRNILEKYKVPWQESLSGLSEQDIKDVQRLIENGPLPEFPDHPSTIMLFPKQEDKIVHEYTRVVEQPTELFLCVHLADFQSLDSTTLIITYPNDDRPAIAVSLRQLLGFTEKADKVFYRNQFVYIEKNELQGGINIGFSWPLYLPAESSVKISNNADSKTGSPLFVFTKENIARTKEPLLYLVHHFEHSDLPITSDTIRTSSLPYAGQDRLIVGGLQVFVDGYKRTGNPTMDPFSKGPIEGNIYLSSPDGSLMPIAIGQEDHAFQGFYDWPNGNVKPLPDAVKQDYPLLYFAYGDGFTRRDTNTTIPGRTGDWSLSYSGLVPFSIHGGERFGVAPFSTRNVTTGNVAITAYLLRYGQYKNSLIDTNNTTIVRIPVQKEQPPTPISAEIMDTLSTINQSLQLPFERFFEDVQKGNVHIHYGSGLSSGMIFGQTTTESGLYHFYLLSKDNSLARQVGELAGQVVFYKYCEQRESNTFEIYCSDPLKVGETGDFERSYVGNMALALLDPNERFPVVQPITQIDPSFIYLTDVLKIVKKLMTTYGVNGWKTPEWQATRILSSARYHLPSETVTLPDPLRQQLRELPVSQEFVQWAIHENAWSPKMLQFFPNIDK